MVKEVQRVLEFYSGIGGMRYSLMKAQVNAQVIEAFEINNIANDVYQHNFSHRPYQGNIQCLTAADLDKYGADAWFLSPPCQPYTRQGLQKDTGDARAFSFLQILELIPFLLQPPSMLFVENVVGFETSDTHAKLIEILEKANFITQEFIMSPLQFGIPYSRPRYFCLPVKRDKTSLKEQCLRYFTPREVANLHSFPEDFEFPEHISLKQRYALLGNSLSIAVVAPLLQYLFSEA